MDFLIALVGQPLSWAVFALAVGWVWLGRTRRLKIIAVVDGDTFVAIDRRGRRHKLRLKGVDAPEKDQPHGTHVRNEVRRLVAHRWVRVRLHGRDRYGRGLASVSTPEGDLAAWLVRQGWAHALPGSGLRSQQVLARLRRRGMWQSWRVQAPWDAASRRGGFWRWLFGRRTSGS